MPGFQYFSENTAEIRQRITQPNNIKYSAAAYMMVDTRDITRISGKFDKAWDDILVIEYLL